MQNQIDLCAGDSRFGAGVGVGMAEGCWGFPYLKIKKFVQTSIDQRCYFLFLWCSVILLFVFISIFYCLCSVLLFVFYYLCCQKNGAWVFKHLQPARFLDLHKITLL